MSANEILGGIEQVLLDLPVGQELPYNLSSAAEEKRELQTLKEKPPLGVVSDNVNPTALDPDRIAEDLKKERRKRRKVN